MVLPADMRDFVTEDLARRTHLFCMDAVFILRGVSQTGQPDHPALFPAYRFSAIMAIIGDEGGRSIVETTHAAQIKQARLPAGCAILDLDTLQNRATWRTTYPDST